MHCSDLALTLNSDYWASKLYSAILCIPQTLPSLLRVISAHLSSALLSYSARFMHCTDLALTLNSHYCTCELNSALFMHYKDLALTVNSHYCASELNSAFLMHSTGLTIPLNSHFCASKLHSACFVDCTDLVLTFNCH